MITLLPNFGAEEGDEGAVGHRPDLQVAALLWRELFPADTRVLGLDAAPQPLAPWEEPAFSWLPVRGGVAWLSTQAAHRRLQRLGAAPVGPQPEVVRRVHDKGFALEAARAAGVCPLGEQVELFGPDELDRLPAALAARPAGSLQVIKPRFGSSGRGRIPVRGGQPLALGAAATERLRRRGGAVLEPWLERVEDLSVQLHVGEDGRVELLGSTRQILAPSGLYLGNRCVLDGRPRAGTDHDEALEAAALQIGAAAARAGFRGPCGVDAFLYREAGEIRLRPIVELNARFTMGTVALGVLQRLRALGIAAGARTYTFTVRPLEPAEPGRVVALHGPARAVLGDPPP